MESGQIKITATRYLFDLNFKDAYQMQKMPINVKSRQVKSKSS